MSEFKTDLGILHNKDCLEVIPEIKPDLVITSPPYNVGIEYDLHNDLMPKKEYYEWIKQRFQSLYNVMPNDGRMAINVPYEVNFKQQGEGRIFLTSDYWVILQNIGWKWAGLVDLKETSAHRRKNTAWGSWFSPSAPYIYNPKECVLIVYKNEWKKIKKGKSYFNLSNHDHKNEFYECVRAEWNYRSETRGLTKANFSLDIPLKALKILSWEEDTIFDPFMGSGTTAYACEILNRKWIGSEISKNYFDIAVKRIKSYTNYNKLLDLFFD